MIYLLLNRKKQVFYSSISKLPEIGFSLPSFTEVQNLAFNYRESGEKVLIKRIRL